MTDKRVEKNQRSIFALKKLLEEVIHDAIVFADEKALLQALNSQGGLAHYTNKERGITSMGLNTAKRTAEKYIDQGFYALDQLRIAAKESILELQYKREKSNKITKSGLLKRMGELEHENQLLKEELLLISSLLQESMRQTQAYAECSGNHNVIQLAKKEQNELRVKLSLKK